MPNPLSYADVREQIQSGDVLAFRGRGLLSRVVQRVDRSRYSHVEVAAWSRWGSRIRRLCSIGAEFRRGVFPVPLSYRVAKYHGQVEWWRIRDPYIDRDEIVRWCLRDRVWGAPYASPRQFWRSFLFRWAWDQPDAFFCSELVANALRAGGIYVPKPPSTCTPQDIVDLPYLELVGILQLAPTIKLHKAA